MERHATRRGDEHRLLTEITQMADRIRGLRGANAMANEPQIKSLTEGLRAKWSELRAMRAGPVTGGDEIRRRGHYD
jgi:hypothetical protein